MTVLPTVQSAVYPRYVELLEMEPDLTVTQAAVVLGVNRSTLEKAIERATEAKVPEPLDMALLMTLAGEEMQLRGWDDMAERCYRVAREIKGDGA